jgi:hypothetical protein
LNGVGFWTAIETAGKPPTMTGSSMKRSQTKRMMLSSLALLVVR